MYEIGILGGGKNEYNANNNLQNKYKKEKSL